MTRGMTVQLELVKPGARPQWYAGATLHDVLPGVYAKVTTDGELVFAGRLDPDDAERLVGIVDETVSNAEQRFLGERGQHGRGWWLAGMEEMRTAATGYLQSAIDQIGKAKEQFDRFKT